MKGVALCKDKQHWQAIRQTSWYKCVLNNNNSFQDYRDRLWDRFQVKYSLVMPAIHNELGNSINRKFCAMEYEEK